ncbi:unnamed protein product [Enterobius vermicularis]|uniref:Nucleotid_trans domain-containing protein n=1 Tax=Enterobius vermicularis TaxID=51028 RepID=A0A0N4V723_ENTVE|nr:unnamed protein product [Enterobius vermicularis]
MTAFRPTIFANFRPSRLFQIKAFIFSQMLLHCFFLLFGMLVLRKTIHAINAVNYVRSNSYTMSPEAIGASPQFKELIFALESEYIKPPAFFLLNQHALNMTFNFLCSTERLGVHERFIFVTLDPVAKDVLMKHWPKIRQLYLPVPSLFHPFSFAESAYQALYYLRASLAVSLLRNGKSFWMMQQDTFWRANLFDLDLEDNPRYDALFDQIGDGENSERAQWINGANFFIKADNGTLQFFEYLAKKLKNWYTPDMGVMIHQCHTWEKPKCAYIPHKIAHSWEWMFTDQRDPPYIIQLDCETNGKSKLMELAKYGFYFMNDDDNRLCNQTAVEIIRQRMTEGKIQTRETPNSWGRFQFKIYWRIVDHMLSIPIIGASLKPYLASAGYLLMITI